MHGILSFAVRVQSPTHPAPELTRRIVQWLVSFRSELEQVPIKRLEHFKVRDWRAPACSFSLAFISPSTQHTHVPLFLSLPSKHTHTHTCHWPFTPPPHTHTGCFEGALRRAEQVPGGGGGPGLAAHPAWKL